MALDLTPFGTCWSCVTDLTMPAINASGFRVVAEAIARRWQTPRGGLVDDPNYGFNLSDFISDDLSPADIARMAKMAAAEAVKDERVVACDVDITLLPTGAMTVTGNVQTAQGPFQLVVGVSQVTVALLQVSGS